MTKYGNKKVEPSEAAITAAVMHHWRMNQLPNTLVASIPNMRAHGQHGLTKGLPDLLVITPGEVGFIELKKAGGKLSKHQEEFKMLCIKTGIRCAVTYGRDEPIQVLEHWGAVKKQVET